MRSTARPSLLTAPTPLPSQEERRALPHPTLPGTKLPEGHVATVTVDDLPDEEEDDGDGLGDFVNDIGGGDDY